LKYSSQAQLLFSDNSDDGVGTPKIGIALRHDIDIGARTSAHILQMYV